MAAYRKTVAYRNSSTYPGGDGGSPPPTASSGSVQWTPAATSRLALDAPIVLRVTTSPSPTGPRVGSA